jgi:cell wall-associated NlpC family hydrolase
MVWNRLARLLLVPAAPALVLAGVGPALAKVPPPGHAATAGSQSLPPGLLLAGNRRSQSRAVAVARASAGTAAMPAVRRLLPADLLIVGPRTLPRGTVQAVRRLSGVTAAEPIGAARITVNGKFIAMLGVDPASFRRFAAGPTARSARLWESVAGGGVAVSYTMGKLDKLPLGGLVTVQGRRTERLRVSGFGTVGIPGVDAVVSAGVARSLGIPAGNAIVVSAPHARLAPLMARIKKLLPRQAAVAALVTQAPTSVALSSGAAGASGAPAARGAGLTPAELVAFLRAALSRVGLPYVWGAAGPRAFDCSGLVQWSLAQAGVVMPRVAADQARTGPAVPVSQLQPGDLLFYHTDPTAPNYISHVAIYIGGGKMLQAPEPGLDVEVVPADFGAEFAGAVRIDPAVAAAVAANPAG